jgi:adenine-specific DNA methylase
MDGQRQKLNGSYYTPEPVVRSLVRWTVRKDTDRLLDPACGDGRFLMAHPKSVGVEQDVDAARAVHARSPGSLMHQGDFFSWASRTHERFECAAGNPPFIRYQRFAGEIRQTALELCATHGAQFSALSSSWAPFIVATAALLKRDGRMAFVVPAEIGHAPYARPLLEYLADHFDRVQVVAVERKMFPDLSEDCWLLHAAGFGGTTDHILLSVMTQFGFMAKPPTLGVQVPLREWRDWNCRLRAFLLSSNVRELYRQAAEDPESVRLRNIAKVGIGYVTGDNDFFHLRPSEAERAGIPEDLLQPTVRNGKALDGRAITRSKVERWWRRDEPNFLLRLRPGDEVPQGVQRYLDSAAGQKARTTYKCRNRDPWYAVPDVVVPDAFLSYMCGEGPGLVANLAGCTGTNSVHMVTMTGAMKVSELKSAWANPFIRLSCEIEGHPLGGGMLKLEPREAGQVLLTRRDFRSLEQRKLIAEGVATMRQWRHCV